MRKHSLIVVLTFMISFLLSLPVQADSLTFKDVDRDNAHFMGIHTLAEEGVINGYPNGNFKPYQSITRSQTAVLFMKERELPVPKDKAKVLKNYKDVTTSHRYADAIAATYEAGIFKGNNGYFKDGALTREQMATVLVKAYGLKDTGKPVDANLSNVNLSHKNNVKILVQNGITNQTDDFRPRESVTRSQFATFLYKTIQKTTDKYKEMQAHFIDVGQGDSILIQTANGENILIDAGIKSAGQKVVSFLKEKDVGKLDMVVATHPHADHIGGLIPVLNEFKVDKFIDSGMPHTSQTYYDLLSLIDSKDIPFEIPKTGQKYSFGDFKMTVLHVDSNAKNVNDSSVVLKGEYDNISFMLTGDAEKDVENAMVNSKFDLESTIYKAGHHGSSTSSTTAFINQVKPETTILSYGKNNSYGHPDSVVVNRLKNIGADIYSTADSGNITITANGDVYGISAKAMDTSPSQPKPDPEPNPKPDPKPEPGVTFPLNINKASAKQLKELPGIGDTLAPRIVKYRNTHGPFKKKTDIMKVKGIGQGTYNKIKSKIVVK